MITDNEGAKELLKTYHKYVPEFSDYETIVFNNKLSNLETYLNGEWDNLIRLLLSLNLIDDEEIKMPALKKALGVFMAAYPVYRAYVDEPQCLTMISTCRFSVERHCKILSAL